MILVRTGKRILNLPQPSALTLHLQKQCNYHALVPNRSVLSLSGRDTRKLLQNLVTNDLTKLNSSSPPLFCAFLTPQGRTIAATFLFTPSTSSGTSTSPSSNDGSHFYIATGADVQDTVLVDVDSHSMPDLLASIKRFKLRSKVTIKDVSERLAVMAHWGEENDDSRQMSDIVSIGQDTRAPGMGARSVIWKDAEGSSSTSSSSVQNASGGRRQGKDYLVHRMLHGVAEASEEVSGMPLEDNIELMKGVDFRKGCYVGQELTARTHHTGVVRKRIVPISLHREEDETPTELAHDPGNADATGITSVELPSGAEVRSAPTSKSAADPAKPTRERSAGKLLSRVDNVGLAMLRLEQVHRCIKDELVMRIPTSQGIIRVRPWLPQWWPESVLKQQEQ